MLRALELFFLRFFRHCVGRSRTVLCVVLGLTGVGFFFALKLRPAFSFYDMMDSKDPSLVASHTLNDNFNLKPQATLLFRRTDGKLLEPQNLRFLCELSLAQEKSPPQFFSVLSAVSFRKARFEPATDSSILPRLLFDQTYSHKCCTDSKIYQDTAVNSPWRPLFAKNVLQDFPWQVTYEGPGQKGPKDEGRSLDNGSRGSSNTNSVDRNLSLKHYSELLVGLRSKLAAEEAAELELISTGTLAFQLAYQKAFFADSRLNLLALVLTFFVCRLFFGAWRRGVLLLGSFVLMGVVIYGGWAATGAPLDLLGNALFLMLMIASVEDLFFVLSYLRSERCHWRKAFRVHLMPAFLTSLTTVIGFGSLCISDLAPIRRFGAFAAAGCFLEWMIVFFVLPAVLVRFPTFLKGGLATGSSPLLAPKLTQNGSRKALFSKSIHQWSGKVTKAMQKAARVQLSSFWAVPLLLCAVAGLFSVTHLRVFDNTRAIFPERHEYRQGLEYLIESRGWSSLVSLLVEPSLDAQSRTQLSAALDASPLVVGQIDSGIITQHMTAGLNTAMTDLVRIQMESGPLSKFKLPHNGMENRLLFLSDSSMDTVAQLNSLLASVCLPAPVSSVGSGEKSLGHNPCALVGDLVANATFSAAVIPTLLESLWLSLILVAALLVALCVSLGARAQTFAIVASALWGPLVLIGLFAVFGVWMNFVTCTFAAVLVGLAGDNAIQFLYSAKKTREPLLNAVHKRGVAAQEISVLMLAMASVFFLSDFYASQRLGFFFVLGFAMNLVGDVWLLNLFDRISKGTAKGSATK